MAANTTPIYVKNITAKGTTWTNSDAASTKKTISPSIGAEGCRVHAVVATLDDTTARDFSLYLNDGTTDFLVGTFTVTASAGTSGAVSSISALSIVASFPWAGTDGSILIPSGWVLKAMNLTQVASAKTATIVAICGDY